MPIKKDLLYIIIGISPLIGAYLILCIYCSTLTPLYVVASESMKPTLNVGDLIIIKNTKEININDIIIFESPKTTPEQDLQPIVHRVINITTINGTRYYQTKGDNNPTPDQWRDYRGTNYTLNHMVSERLLKGKVISTIPLIGLLILYFQTTIGTTILLLIIIICIIVEIAIYIKEKRQKTEHKKNFAKKRYTVF